MNNINYGERHILFLTFTHPILHGMQKSPPTIKYSLKKVINMNTYFSHYKQEDEYKVKECQKVTKLEVLL